jgi:hypothetical protein
LDTILFTETFNATGQNTNNWKYTSSTLTCLQNAGRLTFGNNGISSGHGATMVSFQHFPVIGTAPLALEFTGGLTGAVLAANEVFAAGFGTPSSVAGLTSDGVYFKLTSAGLVGVVSYNGVAVETGVLVAVLSPGSIAKFTIIINEGHVDFWVDDILMGTIEAANGQPLMQGSSPVFMQRMCTGNVMSAAVVGVTDVTVSLMDVATNKPWAHQMATQGQSGYVGQNGNTMGKTALWNNSTPPTASALANATCATPAGLGGRANFLPTLTANTDGILMAYQNPASAAGVTGRNLVITGVWLQSAVSVALVGGPLVLEWALAFGHTSISLATTESTSFASGTTHAPRIAPLGFESFPVTSAIGTVASTAIDRTFSTPIVVRPGEWVAIICTNIGTVTSAGAITTLSNINAYWE